MPDTLTRVTPGAALVAGIDRTAWRAHVWAADDLTTPEKVTALAYAEHAGRGTTAVWVAPDRLELMTGLGRTARKAAVRGLTTKGWLVLTAPGRGHRAARYALMVPPHPSGNVRLLLDDPSTPAEPADVGSPADPPSVVEGRETTPDRFATRPPREARGSRDDPRRSADDPRGGRETTPNTNQNTNQNTNPRADVDDQLAAVRREAVTRLVGVVREAFPAPTTGIRLDRDAEALRASGWTPDALATALAAVDLTGARSPSAVLRGRLSVMASDGPPPAPRKPTSAASTTCPVHGTTTSGACSSCSADHKAGQHRDDEDGPSTACHLCTSSRRSAA